MGETEPFRHDDTIKAEHQVDDKFGCVTSSDLAEKENPVGERAKKRCVVSRFLSVTDNRDSLPLADFLA